MFNTKNFCKKCPLKKVNHSADKSEYRLELIIHNIQKELLDKEYKARQEEEIKSYNKRHRFQRSGNYKSYSPEGYIENIIDYFKDDAERKGWTREIAESLAGYMIANKYIIVAEEIDGEFYLRFDKKETYASPKEVKITFQ